MFDVSRVGSIDTSIAMRDGFFYIANSESKKIMELNSYGDLLTIYYNEDFNPVPSFSKEQTVPAQQEKPYPIRSITLRPFLLIHANTFTRWMFFRRNGVNMMKKRKCMGS